MPLFVPAQMIPGDIDDGENDRSTADRRVHSAAAATHAAAPRPLRPACTRGAASPLRASGRRLELLPVHAAVGRRHQILKADEQLAWIRR